MRQELRSAAIFAAALAFGGFASAWRGHSTRALLFLAAGSAVVLWALVSRVFASRFHRAWMRLARALGRINSTALLTLVYLAVFVPYRLIGQLAGRDPLARRTARESYWICRTRTRQEHWQFERMY